MFDIEFCGSQLNMQILDLLHNEEPGILSKLPSSSNSRGYRISISPGEKYHIMSYLSTTNCANLIFCIKTLQAR